MSGALLPFAGGAEVDLEILAPSGERAWTVAPSGDASGARDGQALAELFAAVLDGGGGTVVLAGTYHIDRPVTVPTSVNLWCQGNGWPVPATRIVCTTPEAGVTFGDKDTGSTGGVSGGLLVDGADVATRPLVIGQTADRTFIGVDVSRSAGDGLILEATQNCVFIGCTSSNNAESDIAFDFGAAGNRFFGTEMSAGAHWHAHFRSSGPSPAGLAASPTDNAFFGGIMERAADTGGVWQQAGDANSFHAMQCVAVDSGDPFTCVKLDNGTITWDGGIISGAGVAVAFDVAAGCQLNVVGEPTVNACETVFKNAGTVHVNGMVRALACTNYWTTKAPVELVPYGSAALGSMPCIAAGSKALTNALATIAASWFALNPANWPTPPAGRTLQFRGRILGQGLTAGDTLTCGLHNQTDAAGFGVAFSAVAGADGVAEAASEWMDFPATAKSGFCQAFNATAARGLVQAATIDVRIA